MIVVKKSITLKKLKTLAKARFGDMIKAVVDVNKKIMVIDAELHADEEALLLEKGSKQSDLWGINLYPEIKTEDWLEYDSMINLRPSENNQTRGVDDPKIRSKIKQIVNQLVEK